MNCPYCSSSETTQLAGKTSLGYPTFKCSNCSRRFNERTGTQFNHLQFPTDIVMLVVLWRLRYKLSLRDLAEMFLVRGFEFTHETVRDWMKVNGKWHYLYRAIDRDGNLIDSMLSEKRDMEAAKRFFKGAREVVGHKPKKVTTDGHDAYPRAIRRILGRKVLHRTNKFLNNRIEQDHRGIKQRYYSRKGLCDLEDLVRLRQPPGFANNGRCSDRGLVPCNTC